MSRCHLLQGRLIQCHAPGLRFELANSDKLRDATYPIEEEGCQFFIVIDCEVSAP